MKTLLNYITERLKITTSQNLSDVKNPYDICKLLIQQAHSKELSNDEKIEYFDYIFNEYDGLKQFLIDYINNHDDVPEMLDEDTPEIIGYLKDFDITEFDNKN